MEDISQAVEIFAAYLNAPRGILDHEEQLLFDEDVEKARAVMERAWLERKPVLSPRRRGWRIWRRRVRYP